MTSGNKKAVAYGDKVVAVYKPEFANSAVPVFGPLTKTFYGYLWVDDQVAIYPEDACDYLVLVQPPTQQPPEIE